MTFEQQIGLIFVGTAFSVVCNLLVGMWIFKWKKREALPEDVTKLEAFRQVTERVLAEMEDRSKDFAIVQIQQSRDMVGLRGEIKYIRGVINGTYWKRITDKEDL